MTATPVQATTASQNFAQQVPWWDDYANQVGWVGLAISIIGFAFTIYGIHKSRSASVAARSASEAALQAVAKFDVTVAINQAMRTIGEMHEFHRKDIWDFTPRNLRDVKELLIKSHGAANGLDTQNLEQLRGVILQFRTLIEAADKKLSGAAPPMEDFARILDEQIEVLGAIYGRLRSQTS